MYHIKCKQLRLETKASLSNFKANTSNVSLSISELRKYWCLSDNNKKNINRNIIIDLKSFGLNILQQIFMVSIQKQRLNFLLNVHWFKRFHPLCDASIHTRISSRYLSNDRSQTLHTGVCVRSAEFFAYWERKWITKEANKFGKSVALLKNSIKWIICDRCLYLMRSHTCTQLR